MANSTVFRPVRGLDKNIQSAGYNEGYVYFATDTKKIYLDANGVKAPMGGNSGIYYGKKNFGSVEEGQTIFKFEAMDLEINAEASNLTLPNVDDLILNLPDGSFYRVNYIEGSDASAIITTERLTIAGSGGGGGGSGPSNYTHTLSKLTDSSTTILSGSDYQIGFRTIAKDSNDEETGDGTYEIKVDNITVKKGTAHQGDNYVEVGDLLKLRGTTVIELYVSMYVGEATPSTKYLRYTIETTEMNLLWEDEKTTTIHNADNNLEIKFSLSGNLSGKNVSVLIDDLYTVQLMADGETALAQTKVISNEDLKAYGIKHGAHTFKMTGYAMVNGTKVEAEPIYKNLIFVESGNTNPVISLNLFETDLTQYNTVFIPVVVYSESNTSGVTVTLKEQGVTVDTWENIQNATEYTWNYTPTESGIRILSATCGMSEASKTVNVEALEINNQEVSDYKFRFNASNFASNEAVKAWNSNGVTASFSDKFDWNNGGLKFDTDNNRSYFCVKAGSTMTINYPMFKENAKLKGKTFKVIFKTAYCRDYDARVLSCNYGSESNPKGFIMNAQGSIINGQSSTLDTQYCEDTYIELEFDISKEDENGVKNYVTMWIDGIPCGFVIYNSTESFTDNYNIPITIGSSECDVHICMMKLYEKGLSREEHLQNFIADAPNAAEMIKRYRRNDILDEYGEISPTKTAIANPDLLVHQYVIPRMTKAKKDAVTGCTYVQYQGSDSANLSAKEVKIKVQGTSSEKYVISAANLDSEFTQGVINNDGTVSSEGWSMDGGTAPKINYFTTKVNVASCENANNALNQEWYNLFQPYKCVLKCKKPNARDTMQFTQGVIFIQDNNNKTKQEDPKDDCIFSDTTGYMTNPYPKFYSIGQMGNSKKNTTVFHDTTNPLECCIEVADNQTAQQHMTSDDYYKNDCGLTDGKGNEKKYFEFRYPDGVSSASQAQIEGWNNFVSWMAHANPQPKYEEKTYSSQEEFEKDSNNERYTFDGTQYTLSSYWESSAQKYYIPTESIYGYDNTPLAKPETYEPYTFKGFIAENQINDETGNPWQKDAGYTPMVKGITVSKYANQTYTHDTYERRMAKMLSECEDHLIMDSVVFHYLMVETHCLIDNIAKNTFWSTEDCQHWSLIKDYDNDTADGNDNEGKLTRTYGMEVMDKMPNSDNYVFNAVRSVWLNFIEGLPNLQDEMYQKLSDEKKTINGREVSCFSKDDYLWFFEQWQDKIPERCYIEDYYRKYFRPQEVYHEGMYREMLMGGKKQYQRKAFETYQEVYMSSKHRAGVFSQNYLTLRVSGSNLKGKKIPAKTYCDCYAVFDIGQQQSHTRVKRNEKFYFVVPVNDLGDGTAGLYPATVITQIGDETGSDEVGGLNLVSPHQITLTMANKLRGLYLHGEDPNSIKENTGLTDIRFEACPMLENLWVGGLTAYTGDLNLSNCANIKDVRAERSTFTAVTIADNAPIEVLKLYNPTSLTLSNTYALKELTIAALDEPDEDNPTRLFNLILNNIDENQQNRSKELLEKAFAAYKALDTENKDLFRYKLQNVDWKIDDASAIDSINYTIDILETLLNECYPYTSTGEVESIPASLTGDLEVTENAYNDINAVDIYNKYAASDVYPNLDIDFTGDQAKLYTVRIYSGSGELMWERKLPAGANVDSSFLAEGPDGAFTVDKIQKSDTLQYSYKFLNKWNVYKDLEPIGTVEEIDGEMPSYANVSTDLSFVPQFSETDRYYSLSFYQMDEEGQNIDMTSPIVVTAKYNTPYSEVVPAVVPYKATPSSYDLKRCYDFKGYSLLKDHDTIVADGYTVTGDQNFYPAFDLISDISKVIHEDWFEYHSDTYTDQGINLGKDFDLADDPVPGYDKETQSGGIVGLEGWSISIKPGANLKGKITIPAEHDGKPVVALDVKFARECPGITHVFMQTNQKGEVLNKLYRIYNMAFGCESSELNSYHAQLQYFDFSTVREINESAFARCKELSPYLFSLGDNTYYLASYAFASAFKFENDSVTFIMPSELRYVGAYAFTNFDFNNIGGNKLQLGNAEKVCKLRLNWPNTSGDDKIQKFTQNALDGKSPISDVYFYTNNYNTENDQVKHNGAETGHVVRDYFERAEVAGTISFSFPKKEA